MYLRKIAVGLTALVLLSSGANARSLPDLYSKQEKQLNFDSCADLFPAAPIKTATVPAAMMAQAGATAGVAALALTEPGHAGKAYRLSGPEALLPAEQVAILARSAVPRVIYVSCNPAALARDLTAFARAPGWRVERAVAIDQFLWSSQVEAVVTLSRGP